MSPKPVIFLSAVSRELKSARQLVANTLTFLGYESDWEDIFGFEQGDLLGMLRRRIDASAGVVQIVGHCHGAEPPAPDDTFGRVSYTQYEALYARQRGKKVWYLFLDNGFPADPCDPEPEEKAQLQRAYRERVHGGNDLYIPIKTSAELENTTLKLRNELARLRRGWGQWAALVLGLLVLVAGAVAFLVHGQHRQTAAIQKQSEGVDAVLDHDQKMKQAMIRLEETVTRAKLAREKLTPEELRARAYAVLEKELGLPAGVLAKELPGLALELYSSPDSTPLMRARAAYALGKFDEAEKLVLESVEQEKKAYESARSVTEDRRKRLVQAYELAAGAASAQIHYAQALEHYSNAAAFANQERDPGEWARVQHMIASTLSDLGRAREVEPILREVVKVRERVLGPEHPDTLMSRNNLATALHDQGKHAEAEQEMRAVLTIKERALGAEHPDTLMSRSNLAEALRTRGNVAEAEQEHRAVLAIRERVLGAEHPATLLSRMGVALALDNEGKFAEAEQGMRAALAIQERVLGPVHPATLGSRINLATVLQSQRKVAEAERELRAVLSLCERVLGAKHPNTLMSRGNLANALQAQGRNVEAEQEHRAVLAIKERVLGAEHPDTLHSRSNVAAALAAQGKFAEAEQRQRVLVTIYERVLGAEHPDTLKSRDSLAGAMGAQARFAESEQEQRAVLAIRERVFGAEDPDVLTACYNLGLCLRAQWKFQEAAAYLRRAEEGREKTLGARHPDSKVAK